MKNVFQLAALAAALALGSPAQALSIDLERAERIPLTGNNSAPQDWRVTDGMQFNGSSFDGVARLRFDNDGDLTNGSGVCSGTLLQGGRHVVTAAHCADDFNVMQVRFGIHGNAGKETRGVTRAFVHSGWTGALGTGSDIAVLELDAPVSSIQGFRLSQSNDVGKDFLIMGYGTTGLGSDGSTDTNWDDWGWAHWGRNTADVTSSVFNNVLWGGDSPYGEEYIADYDGLADPEGYNSLGWLGGHPKYGNGAWSSGTGLGVEEALIAGGDSGGGDFVWSGSEWLLSGVHSWGMDLVSCDNIDASTCNGSSWGDLSGSTAVFSHYNWIQSVTNVPEPGTLALLPLALGGVAAARRRKG